jgi:hypothetical protein
MMTGNALLILLMCVYAAFPVPFSSAECIESCTIYHNFLSFQYIASLIFFIVWIVVHWALLNLSGCVRPCVSFLSFFTYFLVLFFGLTTILVPKI